MRLTPVAATSLALRSAGEHGLVAGARAEGVVLLHGLGRTPRSMRWLGKRLQRHGFAIFNFGYDWRAPNIDCAVEQVHAQYLDARRSFSGKLHFVTYSLGGLVLRAYLPQYPPEQLGRAVMIAPPNHGSEIVDRLGKTWWFRWLFGPLACQLGTGARDLPACLPPPACELGVIAGSTWLNPVGRLLVARPSDGTVSVAATQLTCMREHLVVRHSHALILRSAVVAEATANFLVDASFRCPPGAYP